MMTYDIMIIRIVAIDAERLLTSKRMFVLDVEQGCVRSESMDEGKLTEQEKAELFQKAVYFLIGFSIFMFILCGVAIIN